MKKNDGMPTVERSGKRMKSEIRVYYGPSQKTILSSFSVDLSTGGLYLQTEYPMCVGDVLTLIFSFPNQEKSVKCNARVAWINEETDSDECRFPPGVGLQFVDLSLEDVMAISSFVENYEVEAAW